MTNWERLKEAKRLVTEALGVLEQREVKPGGEDLENAIDQLDCAHAAIEAAMAHGESGS